MKRFQTAATDCQRGFEATAWRSHGASGFTLLELMLAVAAAAILLAIAVPSYSAYVLRARMNAAISDIGRIELAIDTYQLNVGQYPPDLAAVNKDDMLDPWGHPYEYLRLAGENPARRGAARKDRNLVPINSDYDLYSSGPDGISRSPLTASHSRDDIVRANDGSFVGPAADY